MLVIIVTEMGLPGQVDVHGVAQQLVRVGFSHLPKQSHVVMDWKRKEII